MSYSVVVFEDWGWQQLLPLVYVRASFQLTCGMDDLLAKVRRLAVRSGGAVGGNGYAGPAGLETWCRPAIAEVVAEQTELPVNRQISGSALLLSGRGYWSSLPRVTAGDESWVGVAGPGERVACVFADHNLASRLSASVFLDEARALATLCGLPRRDVSDRVKLLDWPWQVVHANPSALVADWRSRVMGNADTWDLDWVNCERQCNDGEFECPFIHTNVDKGSYLLGLESIQIGARTRIKPCVVIDAENGPVWIAGDVTVQPHCYIQGPAYIGPGCLLQPGTVIREGTTLGPQCKVGGEIEGSIIHGYSNKQHDGFLGHSYVGSWVNIAADCINSDLKNTYGTVRVPINGCEVETDEMFVGMLVGDYSKMAINVSVPTGAVVGFCSNVLTPRSPKFVPSFAWVDDDTIQSYDVQRGLAIARKMMLRRNCRMTAAEERLFLQVRQQAMAIERVRQASREAKTRAANPAWNGGNGRKKTPLCRSP